MPFDAVFQQPEIITGLDDLELEVTTYSATATRAGSTWTVTARDLPDGLTAEVQGKDWLEAEGKIQHRVAEVLGIDRAEVVVSVDPADPPARAALHALVGARIARARAEQAERDAARHAARLLVKQGWTTEDTGMVLRLPEYRISRLVASTAGTAD